MKIMLGHMSLLGVVLASLFACDSSGQGKNPNPFDKDKEQSFIKVASRSNADTLFLSWELTDDKVSFDHYQISASKPGNVVNVDRDATEGFLTYLPYDELVDVSFSLVDNEEVTDTYKMSVKIDGLDATFASMLIPDRGSVTGGDGMYSIPLPDGRSIFLMGDSYIGTVTNGQRSKSDHMYRNTYIVYDDGEVSAIYGANGDKTSGAVPPGVTGEHEQWYWPGHGFVKDDKLYIFQTLMYQGGSGMWGFMYDRTDILEYDLPGIELRRTSPVPFSGSKDIHYGMAALNDGDYIYIYAQVDVSNDFDPIAEVFVARTTIDKLYDSWEYYNGSGWSNSSSDAVKLAGLASVPVSSQFNVFKLRDKYVLLTQNKKFNSGEIYTFISDTPYGPWKNRQLIFKTYEQNTRNLFTYNAMAHPQFEKDGMILVSYNVNTEDFNEQSTDVSTYRPRFFWVEIDKILNN